MTIYQFYRKVDIYSDVQIIDFSKEAYIGDIKAIPMELASKKIFFIEPTINSDGNPLLKIVTDSIEF